MRSYHKSTDERLRDMERIVADDARRMACMASTLFISVLIFLGSLYWGLRSDEEQDEQIEALEDRTATLERMPSNFPENDIYPNYEGVK